jgi:two-component system cell cycle response regulator
MEMSGMSSKPALNTERPGADPLRSHQKDRYRSIIENLPNPVIVLDNDNRVDALSRTAAAFACASAGCGKGSGGPGSDKLFQYLLRKPVGMVFPWISGDIQSLDRSSGGDNGFEKRVELDGVSRNFRVLVSDVLDAFGKRRGSVIALDDITEKRQAEIALRDTTENLRRNIDELQRANQKILKQQRAIIEEERLKVLLQMAGATAHELNQPLMALLGNIELMTWEKDDSEKLVNRAKKIEKAGKRIADMVKKIQTIRHYELKPYAGDSHLLEFDRKVHILAVDDSDSDIDHLETLLADRKQVHLSRAHDIREVFCFISKTPVDLIFLDYLLPSGTGLDVLKKLREEGRDVPVIFITGQGDEMIASQAINSGAYDYLPKVNVTRESLNRVIKNTLDKFRLKKEVEAMMEKLAEMTIRDELTHLYNRRYFMEVFERETAAFQRYDTQLVLCMMDLDHFKNINDTYGHPAGDALLRSVAELLQKTVRKSDIPCRYGGEEFAVILPNTGIEHAKVFCERFREKVENLVTSYGEEKLKVTISIGLAQFSKEKSSEALLERADHALYLAKSGGRNRVASVPLPSEVSSI